MQLSEWQARGDWRLLFLNRDAVAKVTAADVTRSGPEVFPAQQPHGRRLPADRRSRIGPRSRRRRTFEAMVKDYKGGETVAAGEYFDPTAENIQKRTTSAS